jgi:LysM repeat protein
MADIAAPGVALSTAPATAAVCPYLLGTDGAWRSSTAARDHRCHAVAPAAPLATDKQRRLCLVAAHVGCSTYNAAMAALEESGSVVDRPLHRPVTRTAPLVLDRGRITVSMPGLPERGVGQGGLVALMAVAFGAIAVTRLGGGPELQPAAVEPGATPSPSTLTTPAPTHAETSAAPTEPTLVPSDGEPTAAPPTATPDPPAKTPEPTPKPTPESRTYTVKSGDNLSGIAAVHGTTWQELARLNELSDPRRLKVGQVLDLP